MKFMSDLRSPFKPDHQYGDWVVVGVDGPDDDIGAEVRAKALEALLENAHNWIPEGHRDKISTIEHPPIWLEDPLKPPGPDNGAWGVQIAWKYTPAGTTKELGAHVIVSAKELADTLAECSDK